MRKIIFVLLFAFPLLGVAQFSFSGYTDPKQEYSSVYLSLVEDYRKLSGVYSEQIISKAVPDKYGYFEFKGNMLENNNRIYRIHVDNCPEDERNLNHFNGHCSNSKELLFIAKNTDTLQLPFSFGKQIFCSIISNNEKIQALAKIDSLKEDMRFAYSEYPSEASRKLNDIKWFKKLQEYGKSLNEPIAELYIYTFLSDRSSDLHNHYVEDLKTNPYYNDLKSRLLSIYPESSYTKQYINELEADQYMIAAFEKNNNKWIYAFYILLLISIGLNIYLLWKFWDKQRHKTAHLRERLSKQEQVVLDLLLQNKSNKAIAEALFLSVSTVKTHTNNIYKKLEVQSREDAKLLFSK